MGQTKEYIVKGAMAQCNQSKVPMIAQLQLIPDNLFVNVNGNLVVTDKSLGPVFGPVPFGVCNMIPPTPAVPTPPCACVILSWSGAYTSEKINQIASPLVKDSKGTCALGGSITFKTTGQFPKPSVPAIPVPTVADMNPMSDTVVQRMKNYVNRGKKKNEEDVLYMRFDIADSSLDLLCNQLNKDFDYKMVSTDKGVAVAILGIKGGPLKEMKEITADEKSKLPTCGEWTGAPGNSVFKPNPETVPTRFPKKVEGKDIKHKPFGKSGDKPEESITGEVEKLVNDHLSNNGQDPNYKFEGVPFDDEEAIFTATCIGEVNVDMYSLDRQVNFQRANELMADDLNRRHPEGIEDPETGKMRPFTAKDVDKWMKDPEHRMTWHERQDGVTMQKVPSVLHGNLNHTGGISKEKLEMNKLFGLSNEQMKSMDYNEEIEDI